MARLRKKKQPDPTMPLAPMIDCVFLMLIYFMVSATLERQEADIAFKLPGVIEQDSPLEMPDEQIIEVYGNGQVIINDYSYDEPDDAHYVELAAMLSRFKATSDANKVDAVITISPMEEVRHQVIIKVMDACDRAGITMVNFAISEEAL
jgi:biopolymer transport protein ExbD